jgi:hypothetical protein
MAKIRHRRSASKVGIEGRSALMINGERRRARARAISRAI